MKKILLIGILVVLVGVVAIFFMTPSEDKINTVTPIPNEVDTIAFSPFDLFAVDEDGQISQFEVSESESKLIKTSSLGEVTKPVETTPQVVKEESPVTTNISDEVKLLQEKMEILGVYDDFVSGKLTYYQDYIVYPYVIQKGDYVLKIQAKLLPETPPGKLLNDLKTINKRDDLNLVYAGDTILFLIEDLSKGYSKEDFTGETVEAIIEEIVVENEVLTNDKPLLIDYRSEFIYVFSNDTKSLYKIDPDKSMDAEFVTAVNLEEDAKELFVQNDSVYIVTKNSVNRFDMAGTLLEKDSIDTSDVILTMDNFYLLDGSDLIKYNLELTSKEIYPMYGKLKDYVQIDNKLYVATDLGEVNDESTLYMINLDTMFLEKAIVTEGITQSIESINGELVLIQQITKESLDGGPLYINNATMYQKETLDKLSSQRIKQGYTKLLYIDEDCLVYFMNNEYFVSRSDKLISLKTDKNIVKVYIKK